MITKKQKLKIKLAINDSAKKILMKSFGCSYSLISHYKNGTKLVSPKRAIAIEFLTGIPAEILRPDIFKGR